MGNGTLVVEHATTIAGTLTTNTKIDPKHTLGKLTIEAGGVYDNDELKVVVNATNLVTNYGTMILGTGAVSFGDGFKNYNVCISTPDALYVSGDFVNQGQYDANEGTLILGGDKNNNTAFDHGSSVYYNIIKSGANTITTASEGKSRTLTIAGTLTVESGTFAADKSDVISLLGGKVGVSEGKGDNIIPADKSGKGKDAEECGVIIYNGATLELRDSSTLNVECDFTNEGTFTGDSTATLHLIGSTFTPGNSGYPTLLKTSEKVTQVKNSTFKFEGEKWTNFGQYQAESDSTVELNRYICEHPGVPPIPIKPCAADQDIISIGAEKAYIAFENIKTNNYGTKRFHTDIEISGTFTIAGGATVEDIVEAAIPPNVYTFTNDDAKMVVSGTWTLKGNSALGLIALQGTDEMNKKGKRWTLILNSSGAVNIDEVSLRDSELITHGGSLNGKNVGYNVVSLGNLSPSWGPFDPVPEPIDPVPEPIEPSESNDVVLSLQTANPVSSSATAAIGNTVKLQLMLTSSGTGTVNGISAYLQFDPTVLSVVDTSSEGGIQPFTTDSFIGGLIFENSAADGLLRYTEGNVTGNATGAGIVASVSFMVNDAPEGDSTAISFLSDAANGLITSVSYSNGETVQPILKGFTLTVGNAPSLPGDTNEDGMVNLVDFSFLSSVFGTADPNADFNGDGYVNLADFSILAANFGKSVAAAAPVAFPGSGVALSRQHSGGRLSLRAPAKAHRGDVIEGAVVATERRRYDSSLRAYSFELSYDSKMLRLVKGGITEGDFLKETLFVTKDNRVFAATRSGKHTGITTTQRTGVLTKLRFQVVADGVSKDAIRLRDVQVVDGAGNFSRLPELHAALRTVPKETQLLANYPNPFNPETWIPFRLADDADVKIQIYDVSGRLVRTLDLGYRSAGFYVDRSAAAYWDGCNNTGERVASGLYLYRLTAGDFSSMRRMVILK